MLHYPKNISKKSLIFFLLHLSKLFFVPPMLRTRLLAMSGIIFIDRKSTFIGADVLFDVTDGTSTTIGKNVIITTGTKIITHYPIATREGIREYKKGNVCIQDNAFIGMNVLIVKPVTIGRSAVVGAGAVVTKDIPDYSIVGGNPATIIGKVTDANP
jgi:acetyltransferase-like isoleucine patch superfamily enzyme